jgi:hypothetical protein
MLNEQQQQPSEANEQQSQTPEDDHQLSQQESQGS